MRCYLVGLLLIGACLVSTLGCDTPQPVAAETEQAAKGPPAPPPPPGWKEPEPAPTADASSQTAAESTAPVSAPGQQTEIEVVEAKKGVGLKGRSLDEYEGIVVTPAKTLFAAKERISFDIEVPHALNLYDAANGGPPQSHEEFMEGVIKANNIKLPQLPEGHEYWYDVQARQLMVKRPKMP